MKQREIKKGMQRREMDKKRYEERGIEENREKDKERNI